MDPNVGAGLPARRKYVKIFIRMKRKTSAWTLYDVENAAGIFFLSKSRPEWGWGSRGRGNAAFTSEPFPLPRD